MRVACLALCLLVTGALGAVTGEQTAEQTKADGDNDLKLFAKYKCYCDTNEAEKKKEIDDGAKMIDLLAGEIAELQAANGKLSSENAELEMNMGDNERARNTASTLRDKANEDFKAEEEDMVAAIGQMDQAIDTLRDKANADFKTE